MNLWDVLQPFQAVLNIIKHSHINITVRVIPLQGKSTVVLSFPVCCYLVLLGKTV